MSCECIDNFEKTIVEKQPYTDLKIISAEFGKALIRSGNTFVARPIIQVELRCEGRKHPVKKDVIYGFCPFCGKPYNPIEKEEVKP